MKYRLIRKGYFYEFDVNGKIYNSSQLSKMLNRSRATISENLKEFSPEQFDQWCRGIEYLNANGYSPQTKPVVLSDGSFTCSHAIVSKTGASISVAHKRLNEYQKGELSEKDLFASVSDERSQRGKDNCRKKSAKSGNQTVFSVDGLGPRKKIEDIPVGSWERDNLDPQHFTSRGSGTGCAVVHI